MQDQPVRPLPIVDLDTRPFWTGGMRGELLIARCTSCRFYVHPPTSFCPRCESREVLPEPVSGRGRIASFTINHKQWMPGLPVPYVLALVELVEQPDVRLATNIVGCAPEDVTFGMEVAVQFEQVDDIWVPLFAPVQP